MSEPTSARPRNGNNAPTSSHNGFQQGIVDKLRHTATAQLTNQKNRATDGLGSIADAVRQSTRQLRDQRHEIIAGYVDQAADQIDQFARRLRERDVTELFDDLQRLSRRQPALFIGGAFAVGFVAARFLKSRGRETRSQSENAGARVSRTGGSGEYRGYANASGYTYPETPISTVHDYTASPSLSGSSAQSKSSDGSEAADVDANAPETGAQRSRSRRTTTQTERL